MNNIDMQELARSHARRRHPRRHVFLKFIIVYAVIMSVIMAVLLCIGWKYASLRDDSLPERTIEALISDSTAADWRQFLITELPKTYPAYEDGERLAREVLADRFSVGEVTYIKYTAKDRTDAPTFLLISDGKPMAEVTLKNDSERLFGLGEWSIDSVEFRLSYFEAAGVEFRTLTVSAFEGSALTVNGAAIDRGIAEVGGRYPALSLCEDAFAADLPCDVYTLSGIYFEPAVTATLNGTPLETQISADDENSFYFAPADGMTHTVSATVPLGVTVRFNGVAASSTFAVRSYTDGMLGEKDKGGDGTPQLLEVWTASGLFFDTEVTAEYDGTELTLLSSDNGQYIFNTPDECRYTLTVLLPRGAEVTVNGAVLGASEKAESGAALDDLADGGTLPGLYDTASFALYSVLPIYDKYTVSGFLAHPTVSATLDGVPLTAAGDRTSGYSIVVEFDYPDDSPDASTFAEKEYALSAARGFAEQYLAYSLRGCGMGSDYERFDSDYAAMLATLTRGTPAFLRLMASYPAIYRADAYKSVELSALSPSGMTAYSDTCVGVTLEYTAALSNDGAEPMSRSGKLQVLLIKLDGAWKVLSFIDSAVI